MQKWQLRISVLAIVLLAFIVGELDITVRSQSAAFLQQIANGAASGAGIDTAKGTSLANFPTSVTTTARAISGAQLTEKSSRFEASSFPASGSQATASVGSEPATRHVIDCLSFAADSSAAVTAVQGTVVVRDGATGAGTIIWGFSNAHAVAAGAGVQTVLPHSICGLNLVGTTNTAMTVEFNAGVTGELQSISWSGYNIQ